MRKILLVIIITVSSTAVAVEEKMRIAVMDLKSDGISLRTARTVSNMLRNELVNLQLFTIVERNQMEQIMKEQGLQLTGCTDQECAVNVGKLMSARKMLVGEVSSLAGAIVMTVRIVDVEKGVSEFAAKDKALSEKDLDESVSRIAEKLAERISEIKITRTVKKREIREPAEDRPFIAPHLTVSAAAGYLLPGGKFADVAGAGFGGTVNAGYYLFRGASVGLNAGYYSLSSEKSNIDKISVAPVMFTIGYSLPLTERIFITPSIGTGASYNTISYKEISSITGTKSEAEGMAGAGICASLRLGYYMLVMNATYSVLYEKSGMMYFTTFGFGLGAAF